MSINKAELGFLFDLEPKAAVEYLQNKGYKVTNDWRELWEDAHAKAFTVSKMTDMELLKDTKGTLEQALKEGWSSQKTQRELTNMYKKRGWWGATESTATNASDSKKLQLGSPYRVKTIYRQNIQSAYNAGRYLEQMKNVDIAPYLQYICVLDDKTRPEHRAMHLKIFKADDPIWAYIYPPNGWGCRCIVRQLTQTEVERYGYTVENSGSNLSTKDVVINDETGETKQVAIFKTQIGNKDVFMQTDAGWSYNVGQAAWNLDVLAFNSLKELPQNVKDRFISEMAENIYNKSGIENLIRETLERPYFASHGIEKPLSWFTPDIIKAIEKEKIRLKTPVIVLEDRQVKHSLGNVKVEKQRLTQKQFLKLYDYVHSPDEIFIDTQENAIVYVKFLPKNEIIDGRNCIKVPVPINVDNPRRPVNFVGTTSRIPYQNTFGGKQTRYKKIK